MRRHLPSHVTRLAIVVSISAAPIAVFAEPIGTKSETQMVPVQQVVQVVVPSTTPKDLQGTNITLTQPVNVLQPIPPAASRIPGLAY